MLGTHTPTAPAPRRGDVRRGARLRHAVALYHFAPETRLAVARKLRAERRSAREDRAQGREVVVVNAGLLGEREYDGRDEVRERHAVVLHHAQELREVEAREHDRLRAAEEREVRYRHEPVDVEERQHADERVV